MPKTRSGTVDDAARLHELGYTTRAVHARWVLEAFAELYGHLTDGGEPIIDDPSAVKDSSFYLSPDESAPPLERLATIVDLAPIIAAGLESEARDE